MKKTKIICSIGPASTAPEVMSKMVEIGMNVARINFSHATMEERKAVVESVHKVREMTKKNVAILYDTKGPEFRSGMLENDEITLVEGKTIRLVKENVLGNEERISVNHPQAIDNLKVGSIVLLENGLMKIEVISVEEDGVTCKIINGGVLGNKKSLNAPGVKLDIPFISDIDREDIIYACEHEGDFIALSFVSCKEDVLAAREILKEYNREDMKVISKIESTTGVENLDSIIDVSDGIMVARGDLGVDVSLELVPIYQKRMIAAANEVGKPAITATHMLESMQENPRPTRAEASDVANAIMDGTDCIMLSGESAAGHYPVESVQTMTKIANAIEPMIPYKDRLKANVKSSKRTLNDAIGISVADTALAIDIKCIIAFTQSGNTARRLAKFRPCAPILAVTFDEVTQRSLLPVNGVTPVVSNIQNNKENDIDLARNLALQAGFKTGDHIIVVAGYPIGSGNTNMMRIAQI